ncbi:19304_t:CDS:2, partial [Entrophospora sp. SA101]
PFKDKAYLFMKLTYFWFSKKRIAEMKAEAIRGKFGQVIQISKTDFVKEVTETSKEAPVVVHLFKDPIVECKLLNKYLNDLAIKYKSTKFVKIIGDQCIPNYPDKNLPTLLIYHNGDLAQQLVGLSTLGGINMKLEAYLLSVDAIEEVLK